MFIRAGPRGGWRFGREVLSVPERSLYGKSGIASGCLPLAITFRVYQFSIGNRVSIGSVLAIQHRILLRQGLATFGAYTVLLSIFPSLEFISISRLAPLVVSEFFGYLAAICKQQSAVLTG